MMNSVEHLLTGLIQGESPLYSTYVGFKGQLGHEVPVGTFLDLVNVMLNRDELRLWLVENNDRTELYEVPGGLTGRYKEIDHVDARFDPFALSLTLGPKAVTDAAPDWKVELGFVEYKFVLDSKAGSEQEALKELARYLPDLELVPSRSVRVSGRVQIEGKLRRIQQE